MWEQRRVNEQKGSYEENQIAKEVIQPSPKKAETIREESTPPPPKRPPPVCPMDEAQRAALVAETIERARRVEAKSSGGAAKSSGGAAQSSGGATQRTEAVKRAEEYEKLKKELEELEETHEKKKELSKRKKNDSGQDLLSYEEGFSWCEKCHYVSDIEKESELNQRFN